MWLVIVSCYHLVMQLSLITDAGRISHLCCRKGIRPSRGCSTQNAQHGLFVLFPLVLRLATHPLRPGRVVGLVLSQNMRGVAVVGVLFPSRGILCRPAGTYHDGFRLDLI